MKKGNKRLDNSTESAISSKDNFQETAALQHLSFQSPREGTLQERLRSVTDRSPEGCDL